MAQVRELPATGFVSLVGAGPGDPDLLTLGAARRLREADLVLHDALVPEAILALAPRARRLSVGKRARRPSTPQRTIEWLLVRAARRGLRVVRLKGGDPFVLGRGGEEALALAAARVPFEVVPGVTSAVAGPALAGIPVTHRGLASAFTVLSGHDPSAFGPVLDAAVPGGPTLVVLMGLGTRGTIAARLLCHGWDPATPAAIVQGAGTPEAARWIGTLADLPIAALPGSAEAPGLVVIGDVVSLADRIGSSLAVAPVRAAAIA